MKRTEQLTHPLAGDVTRGKACALPQKGVSNFQGYAMTSAEWVEYLMGSGTELTILQMSVRAGCIFFLALAMLRTAGRRSLGKHSAFDTCVVVLLGAVLSRAVVGASPFVPTVGASLVIVLLHRLLGLASIRWEGIERLINGEERRLVENGKIDWTAMRKALLTRTDLDEALRQEAGATDLSQVKEVILERDGKVTVLLNKAEP